MMRALNAFQRLSSAIGVAPNSTVTASMLGAGGCRLRGLTTATTPAEQSKPQPIPDALDQEFDRGDNEAMAKVHEAEWEAQQLALKEARLKVPVDLECEYDRDDPECVDKEALFAEPEAAIVPEVDLDTEMDRDDPLLADKRHLWDPPPPLPEVDLDTELDRDDPLLADKSHLWDAPPPPCPANIDNEMDLAEEEALVQAGFAARRPSAEPAPPESGDKSSGGSAGSAPFGQGARRPPEHPDERIGQYRE